MRDLRKKGWSYVAIGKKINCDHTTVMYYIADGKNVAHTVRNKKPKKKQQFDSLGRPIGRTYAQILTASGMRQPDWLPDKEED